MIIKQCQFKGIDDKGHIFVQPLVYGRGLEKNAAAVEMRSKLHPRVQDFVRAVRPTPSGIYVLVNALGAGEYWGSNVNGDLFPEKALIHSPPDWENLLVYPDRAREVGQAWPYGYPTFMGAYPYKHHVNKDPSRAFGRVELATWNPNMHRVELVVYLDRALCMQFDAMDVIERIENGEFPDVSMGCKVPYDVCTICEKQSKTMADYCEHAATMMNRILPDGRKVAVRNDFPKFFDISFVFIGADKTAKVMAKLAQKGSQVCMGDFCTIARPSASVAEIFSKEAAFSDKQFFRTIAPATALAGAGVGAMGTALKTKSEERTLGNAAKRALVGGAVGGGASLLASAFSKTADPADELAANMGYSKERAIAEAASGERFVDSVPHRTPLHRRFQRMEDRLREDPTEAAFKVDQPVTKTASVKVANDPIKKKIRVAGIPVWLEWLKGETREYKKGGVVKYSKLMKADYGYLPGTMDSDGEELDIYWGGKKDAKNAFVVRQMKKTGGFDEHKVMLGYGSKAEAKASYDYHMGDAKERFGGIATVPVSALIALFADNKGTQEKHAQACSCHGLGDDCGGSTDKLAAALFQVSKSASQQKLSELIKSIPAGPFSQETLPKLERAERNIPNDVLDLMGGLPLGDALSTPTMAGMVLKPHEFQRVLLISIGEKPLADELDQKNMTFGESNNVDESIPLSESSVEPRLMELLSRLGLVRDRSAAAPALANRSMGAAADKPFQPIKGEQQQSKEPVLNKIAALYNGYRQSLLKKAASISNYMTTDPQLRSELFGSSMVEAFACGIDKVASARVLSPDSLAYLVGAYTDRDQMTDEVVASLAQTGAVHEAA